MAESIEDLLDRARAASPNDRIDKYRDKIAGYGAEGIDAMGEWLADPELCRFAVRVIGRAADLGARDPAIAKLNEARADTTPAQRADIDQELRRLGVNPGAKRRASARRSRTPRQRGSLKDVLYAIAQGADPERRGIHAEVLWKRIEGLPEASGRDASSVASALNVAHDLFERIPDEPATFRWLADARPVHDQAAGALSGRRLAVVAHFHARQLDPGARGLNYQKLTGSVIGAGDLIAGVDWGAAVNHAVSGATDLFERIGRGEYRWLHAPIVTSRGWMMRTNRDIADWVWSEVEQGRLRQGWGSHPDRDLDDPAGSPRAWRAVRRGRRSRLGQPPDAHRRAGRDSDRRSHPDAAPSARVALVGRACRRAVSIRDP